MWNRISGNGGSKAADRGLKVVNDLTAVVLATLSDHVAIADADGNIIAVNEAWKSFDCECGAAGLQRSGIGSNYLEICDAAERAGAGGVEGAALGLRAVLEGSRPHFSLAYLCHEGSGRRWFRMSATPIGSPPDGVMLSHTSVGKPAPVGEAALTATTAPAETGEPLLGVLTENLAKTIGARFAFLSEVVDQRAGRVRLIALWSGEGFEESFEYDVDGTPCRGVLNGGLCLYPANVQESFPDDVWLKEIAAECYLAVPMFGSTGEVIGHVGVVHDQTLDNLALAEQVLRAVGAQAAIELDRMQVVRALQKSQRTSRVLLNAPQDSAMLLEPDGTISDLNEAAALRLSQSVEEAVGKNVFDLFPPELAATRRAAIDEVLTSRKPLRMEDERAGMHFESYVWPVMDPQGEVESVAIFVSNVTARKVAEDQLRRSEETIRSLVESANEGIVSVNNDGRIELANPAAEKMFGYGKGELDGQPIESLVPERHRDQHVGHRTGYISDPEPRPIGIGMDLVGRRKDGTEFPLEISLSPVEGSDRKQIMAMISDITERKQAENSLRESEEKVAQSERRMRQVTEHITEMVWLSDPDAGELLYVNPAYEEVWGRSCQSLYDDPRSWLKAVHPDDLERVKAGFGQPEEMFEQEYRIMRPDGSVRWIWDRSFPIAANPDGRSVKAGISIDVTDRKLADEALNKSAERNAALIATIPDMMFTLDKHGVYLDFVPTQGQEPYVPADHFLGKTVVEVMPATLAQDTMQAVELALTTGRQQELAYEMDLDDGKHEYQARIIKSKDDEALAIVRDVTAVKRLEREERLRRERDELEGTVEKEMLGKNPYGLTFREFTVLHLAADGEADKAIADQLGISTFTVSKHVANILGKMAAASRTEACVRALREGLLT